LIGLLIIYLNLFFNNPPNDVKNKSITPDLYLEAVIFILIAMLFHGFYFVTEEKLYKKYFIKPFVMLLWEGIYGIIFTICFILIS